TTLLALGCGSDNSYSSGKQSSSPTPAAAASTSAATAARAETASPSPAAAAASPGAGTRGAATMPPTSNSADPLVREDDPAIQAQKVQFPGPAGTVFGYLARPRGGGPVPAVILV